MFIVPALRRARTAQGLGATVNGFESELARWLGRADEAPADRALEPSLRVQSEKEGVWEVSLDVPGVSREQLSIDIDARRVSIATVKDAPRQYASAFMMPAEVDASASEAQLENGVLTLKLARKVIEKTATQLTIN